MVVQADLVQTAANNRDLIDLIHLEAFLHLGDARSRRILSSVPTQLP